MRHWAFRSVNKQIGFGIDAWVGSMVVSPGLARVAESVDARVSKTRSLWECRFDSGSGYHLGTYDG
jgi:hypothetical protein